MEFTWAVTSSVVMPDPTRPRGPSMPPPVAPPAFPLPPGTFTSVAAVPPAPLPAPEAEGEEEDELVPSVVTYATTATTAHRARAPPAIATRCHVNTPAPVLRLAAAIRDARPPAPRAGGAAPPPAAAARGFTVPFSRADCTAMAPPPCRGLSCWDSADATGARGAPTSPPAGPLPHAGSSKAASPRRVAMVDVWCTG